MTPMLFSIRNRPDPTATLPIDIQRADCPLQALEDDPVGHAPPGKPRPMTLRIPAATHAALQRLAHKKWVSMNQLVTRLVERAILEDDPETREWVI
jgi:hypothetical protein